MAPRKGGASGGKKKGSAKKRKNVWDDYVAPAKRSRGGADTSNGDASEPRKKPKRESRESMFGQWKKQKQQMRTKTRAFASAVEQRRHEQREAFLALKQRHADALHASAALDPSRLTKKQRRALALQQQQQQVPHDRKHTVESDDSDASSGHDSDSGDEPTAAKKKKARGSLFDQFVQTFRTATQDAEPEHEDDDSEYEEVLVNEDGEEIDEDGNVVGPHTDDDDDDNDDERRQADAEAAESDGKRLTADDDTTADENDDDDDAAAGNADDDTEQLELTQDQDPYRRRFLLTNFEERDAREYDALPKAFASLAPLNAQGQVVHHAPPAAYSVAFRRGSLVSEAALAPVSSPLFVRSRLLDAWKAKQLDPAARWTTASLEYTLFHQLCAYKDVFFAAQTLENTETLRRLSAMHVLNHIVKARDTVTRNNERLRRREAKVAEAAAEGDGDSAAAAAGDDQDDREYRDQGFCRATVLVLLPLRSSALAFVKLLLELLPAAVDTVHNKDRFFHEFGSAAADEADDGEDAATETDGLKEWQRVFATGNNDDCFQLGLSLSRKTLRFYSEYHSADLILASPLGLRQLLGDDVVALDDDATDAAGASPPARLATDVLSSIEVCVVDSASLMLMQNVEHLRLAVRALNVQPREAPRADFARVRAWGLASLGAYLRQTVVFAHGVEPALNHLVTKCCRNVGGALRYAPRCDPADGSASIARVVAPVKQIFQRVDAAAGSSSSRDATAAVAPLSAADEAELRFAYFRKHVFEPLLDRPQRRVLVFVPSYFDYVRVRNLFNDAQHRKLIRCVQCCEYTTPKQVARARTAFFHGKAHVLLVTERFHFYHQYELRGARRLVWYGPPQMGAFYSEVVNMLGGGGGGDGEGGNGNGGDRVLGDVDDGKSSAALFTRLDLFRLQRIVGHKRAERMCQPHAAKPTFLFC
ncbi:hypothetical protein PybrP1_011022 [[Pythium] brassicae (nom. inval.)]|nr:hypothetical protein PybrP1_011022 [[Pythium] brassicae (nom. inval.)]